MARARAAARPDADTLPGLPGGVADTPARAKRSGAAFMWGLPAVPTVGTVVEGKYRVEGLLGEGAMGIVLAARHIALDEPVALKVMHPRLANSPDSAKRFVREVKATFGLVGPHVVRTREVGTTAEGLPYSAMERLVGMDLERLLEQRAPLAVREAARYALEACRGLSEAHARGVIHRDVKPSNLFRVEDAAGGSTIKVLDFGIAKLRTGGGSVSLTATDAGLGSPAYMSPEQIRDAKCVDARTDVWSVGVTLFRLLTAKLPFRGDSAMSLSAAIVVDRPTPLREARPDCPPGLAAIVARCLEKAPADRYPSVDALADALAPFATGKADAPPSRSRRSRSWLAATLAATIVAACAVTFARPRARERGNAAVTDVDAVTRVDPGVLGGVDRAAWPALAPPTPRPYADAPRTAEAGSAEPQVARTVAGPQGKKTGTRPPVAEPEAAPAAIPDAEPGSEAAPVASGARAVKADVPEPFGGAATHDRE